MNLDKYEKRLMVKTMSEAFVSDTVSIINADFTNAPSYRQIELDGVLEDCTFKLTKEFNKREILLRPQTTIDIGMYVLLETDKYIVTECVKNEIYPKAEIMLCNNTLRWRDTLGTIKEYSCFIKGDSVSVNEEDALNKRLVMDSDAKLVVVVQYNDDTRTIEPKQRFIFDGQSYDVTSIDKITEVYNGKGVIKLTVEAVSLTDTDDVVNNLPDETGNSDWSGW